MSNTFAKVKAGMFAAATVAALGFGATQAVAVPVAADSAAMRACDPATCYQRCRLTGQFGSCSGDYCYCRRLP